jgi:hypothetical protein
VENPSSKPVDTPTFWSVTVSDALAGFGFTTAASQSLHCSQGLREREIAYPEEAIVKIDTHPQCGRKNGNGVETRHHPWPSPVPDLGSGQASRNIR